MCAIVRMVWATGTKVVGLSIYASQMKVWNLQHRKHIYPQWLTVQLTSVFAWSDSCKHSSIHCSLPVVKCSVCTCFNSEHMCGPGQALRHACIDVQHALIRSFWIWLGWLYRSGSDRQESQYQQRKDLSCGLCKTSLVNLPFKNDLAEPQGQRTHQLWNETDVFLLFHCAVRPADSRTYYLSYYLINDT